MEIDELHSTNETIPVHTPTGRRPLFLFSLTLALAVSKQ
jgi:hypothetical protein